MKKIKYCEKCGGTSIVDIGDGIRSCEKCCESHNGNCWGATVECKCCEATKNVKDGVLLTRDEISKITQGLLYNNLSDEKVNEIVNIVLTIDNFLKEGDHACESA